MRRSVKAAGRQAPARRPASSSGPGADATSAAARTDALLVHALAFFRIGGLVEIAAVLALDWRHYRSPAAVLALVGVVAAESLILVGASWRKGQLRQLWIAGDLAFLVGCLVTCAELTAPADGHTWVYFMYPFTVITSYAIGIAFPRFPAVAALTAVLAGGYALAAIAIHHDPPWNVLPNAVTYFANTSVTWAIARELRRSARSLDSAQTQAVGHAADLAQERERARHARILHDHVLQTLESLVRTRSIADDNLQSHIAAQASWLRALVEGTPLNEPGDVLSRLQEIVRQQTSAGLRVEFNNAELHQAPDVRRQLQALVTDAIADAVAEALTNVAKHSGTRRAIMRAGIKGGQLTVSVLDHGLGFDPEQTPQGIGLAKSIIGRVHEVGGTVRIDSASGAGTYVELSIPVARWEGERCPGDEQGADRHQPCHGTSASGWRLPRRRRGVWK